MIIENIANGIKSILTNTSKGQSKEGMGKGSVESAKNTEGLSIISLSLEAMQAGDIESSLIRYSDHFVIKILKERETSFWVYPSNKPMLRNIVKIFQNFVRIDLGSHELFGHFFTLFQDRMIVINLGMIELLVKFLPSLGIKTKILANQVTNLPKDSTKAHDNLTHESEQLLELKGSLTKAWHT